MKLKTVAALLLTALVVLGGAGRRVDVALVTTNETGRRAKVVYLAGTK